MITSGFATSSTTRHVPGVMALLLACLAGQVVAAEPRSGLDVTGLPFGADIVAPVVRPDGHGHHVHSRIQRWNQKYQMVQVDEPADLVRAQRGAGPARAKVADHLIVKLKPGVEERRLREFAAGQGMQVRRHIGRSDGFLVSFPVQTHGSLDQARQLLMRCPEIASVGEDWIIQLTATPNDPAFGQLWGMLNAGQSGGLVGADIKATQAWNISTGSRNAVVGIIDTGIDYNHPDLAANMWVNPGENGLDSLGRDKRTNGVDDDGNGYVDDWHGWDFVNNDNDPMDDHYHGTHCAGTIGGVGNNGQGVAGVCWQVSLVGLKFLSASGSGATSDAIEAVQYAANMPFVLTSNSWGGGGFSQELKDAIDLAGSRGQLFVAAAGNSAGNNDTTPSYPASYLSDNIIAVAATDRYDQMASFSCYGATSVDLGAPGVDIYSCQPGNLYQNLSGTSMATPHVSGACALLKSVNPSLTGAQIKQALLAHVDPIPALTGKCVTNGRLNLYASVMSVAGPSIGLQARTIVEEGNGDGLLNPGESAACTVTLASAGSEAVVNAVGRITTSDSAVTILDDTVTYGTLASGQTSSGNGMFRVRLAAGTPTPHPVLLTLTVTAATGGPWSFPVTCTYTTSSTIAGHTRRLAGTIIPGAVVSWTGTSVGQVVAGADGAYSIMVGDGTYVVSARAAGYMDSAPVTVTTPPNSTVDLALGFVDVDVKPGTLILSVAQGQTNATNLTVANLGDSPLTWSASSQGGATWAATGLWHQTTWRSPDTQTNWYYGRDDTHTYDTGAANQGTLTCNVVAVPASAPTLTFRQWRQTEGGTSFDVSMVEVSSNQGASWTTVNQVIDTSASWVNASVSLSAYAGQTVSLRFRFDTIDAVGNQYEGWYVGDIRINGQAFGSMLTATPLAGTLAGGQQTAVAIKATPGQRVPGTYTELIRIASNDPSTPQVIVPATILVTAAPILTAGLPLVNDDAIAPSIGDGDGQAEPGETIEIRVPLANSGAVAASGVQVTLASTSAYTTVSTGTVAYPTLAAGGSGQPLTPCVVAIAANCPDNTVIPFTLDVRDVAGRHWPTTFSLTVRWASRLSGTVRAVGTGTGVSGAIVAVGTLSAITASNGTYAINGIPSGTFTATVYMGGYVSTSQAFTFPTNRTWDPLIGTRHLAVTPATLSAQVSTRQSLTSSLSLTATGTLPANWTASAVVPGAGYQIKTSDQPGGPAFVWNDISATGTLVTGLGDDTNVGPFPIGFTMPFYGQSFTSLRVCSNGWVSFTSAVNTYSGVVLPSVSAPENLIAGLWRDLYPPGGGTVHYRQVDSGTFVVQFTNIPRFGATASLCTFQIVLKSNGAVLIYYQRADDPTMATVGIQNATGSQGVTAASNQAFLHAGLAVQFQAAASWLSVAPASGVTAAGATSAVVATFNAASLAYGQYTASVTVTSDDTSLATVTIPVTLTVISANAPVAAPVTASGDEDLPVALTLLGSDVDGDALTYTIVTYPSHGVLSGTGPTRIYTPIADWSGTETFTYQVSDGYRVSDPATVTVTIAPVNDAPVMASRIINLITGSWTRFNLYATDVDGDALTYTMTALPTHGQLVRNGMEVMYTPELGFIGDDSVSITVSDGLVNVDAIVTFRVTEPSRDWPTLGNGPDHTGFSMEPLRVFAPLTPLWTATFDQPINQVAVGDGSVFVTPVTYFGDTYLASLDVATGGERWRHTFDSAYSINPPTVHDGSVYVQRGNHASDTQLWRLATADGAVIWQAPHAAQWERYLAPTVVGDRVWVAGGSYGGMYGFDRSSGAQINFLAMPQFDEWTPTAANGEVYSWVGDQFAVHDPVTGAVQWSLSSSAGGIPYSMHTAVVADGQRAYLFAATPSAILIAIDLKTRGVIWARYDDYFRGLPALDGGTLYMYGSGGIVAMDAATGVTKDTYNLSGTTGTSIQPIVTPDALIGSNGAETAIFALGDPVPRQTLPVGGHLSLAGNRLLIAGDSTLYAYRLPNRPPVFASALVTIAEGTMGEHRMPVFDQDGDTVTFSITGSPAHGVAEITDGNLLHYVPSTDFNGDEIIQVSADDGQGGITVNNFTFRVTPVNDVPVADIKVASITANATTTITLTGHDADGDAVSYRLAGQPAYGVASISGTTLTYVTQVDWSGTEVLQVIANDGTLDSLPASVTINVAPLVPSDGDGIGLLAEYRNTTDLTGTPLVRVDPVINSSAMTFPAPTIPNTNFSVRWTGEILPRDTGAYAFIVNCDDGVRLWVNGTQIINRWVYASGDTIGQITLQGGQRYSIRMEYYQGSGGYLTRLEWAGPNMPRRVVPASRLFPFPGTGLMAQYFDNMDLTNRKVVRVDPTVNFNWGSGSPISSIGADTFSARWTGKLLPRVGGTYTFAITSDNGRRLWINDQLVIDKWIDDANITYTGSIALEAGKLYDVRLEYFENTGGAGIRFEWEYPGQVRQVVPASRCFPVLPVGGGTGLLANYYPVMDLTGTPILTRTDARVDFNWGNAAPDATVPADRFSTRWVGQVEPRCTAAYTFTTTSDDGVRLWVNGSQVINNWTNHSATQNRGTITLQAGQRYEIRMEYYDNTGGAVARLEWECPGMPREVVPAAQLWPMLPPGTGTGLAATYYANMTLTEPAALNRTDAKVDFSWGTNAPEATLPTDRFSVRWNGSVQPRSTGTYTFTTTSDDGVRLWVNNQPIINNWTNHGTTANSGQVVLQAGVLYAIRMEYYENTGGAVARLEWESTAQVREIIPPTQLYPEAPLPTGVACR